MRKQYLYGIIASCVFLTSVLGCSSKESKDSVNQNGSVSIVTTLYPLEDFAKKIGGSHVQVTNIIPAGTESHDFEPSAKDLAKLSKANIFVYHGSGFESWTEKAASNLDKNKTKIVNASDGLASGEVSKGSETKGEHDHGHDHEGMDPHVWLDPTLAKKEARKIYDAIVSADPTHKEEYTKNFAELEKQFDQLDGEFQTMAKQATKKEFVTSHAAFSYLAHRYGLEQISISGLSPEDEPNPKELKEIIDEVKEHQVKYIFFETLVSGKMADVVKNEVKAEALILNPLEGLTAEEIKSKQDYFSVMRKNKENLAKALGAM
ncbi:zinc transport system substrate-binding protein [Croceifilum oryzae]|uniref:Zinc transport system substrate-binding protein n=1 Tax=Croceifilum oryzae TaxID=1553429 RepID=A0AAJ1TKV0_9BACL|nr:metal ABC transporter substrate-binding protein [Croceifilum oryzae]MDQ0417979.1 zinc transport system substrate-binding protein [Croceifilum oryzae]